MQITIPNKEVALKLLSDSHVYINKTFRAERYNNIDRVRYEEENTEFIEYIYMPVNHYKIFTIEDKCLLIYGPDEHRVYINTIYVDPEYHGKGYGKELIQHVIKDFENNYYPKYYKTLQLATDKNNERAIKFYQNNGFNIISDANQYMYSLEYKRK